MQVNPGEAFTIRREDGQFQCITGKLPISFSNPSLRPHLYWTMSNLYSSSSVSIAISSFSYNYDRYGFFFRADTDYFFVLFSTAIANDRYVNADFLEPIFRADTTLEIQSSGESTIWICSLSHSGSKHYTHSPIPLPQNINQSNRCIWYRPAKSVAVLLTGYGKNRIYWLALLVWILDVFFWLVVVLICVQWYFQMHAWYSLPCPTAF